MTASRWSSNWRRTRTTFRQRTTRAYGPGLPFFAKGIAYGDVVSASDVNQELQFRQVVRPSGHGTLRLIIYDEQDVSSVQALLEQHGCSIEQSHLPGLISVDVPPEVSFSALKPLLDEGEARERWGYEEACLPST